MNKKEIDIIRGIIVFIGGILFAFVLFVIVIVSSIVFLPIAITIWLFTTKSFVNSWGGIENWWRIFLDMLKEIEDKLGLS